MSRRGHTSLSAQERYRVSKHILLADKWSSLAIRVGGATVLLMVFGILVFIVIQVVPLFSGARVTPAGLESIGEGHYVMMGVDEWMEYPFLMSKEGDFHFFPLEDGAKHRVLRPDGFKDSSPTAWAYHQEEELVALASESSELHLLKVAYRRDFDLETEQAAVSVSLEPVARFGTGLSSDIVSLHFDQTERRGLMGLIERDATGMRCYALSYRRQVGLLKAGSWEVDSMVELTEQLSGKPTHILAGGHTDFLLVSTEAGYVDVFVRENGQFRHRQSFRPFKNAQESIVAMDWLAGRRSVYFAGDSGEMALFSPAPDAKMGSIQYSEAYALEPLSGAPDLFAASIRNRVFMLGSEEEVSLRYGTTGKEIWQGELPFTPRFGLIGSRYRHLLFLDTDHALHRYALDNPHPEASLKGFFGKIRYEGQAEARYVWQSTGGGDAFEPKLSLIPLIVGTLKGTLYAMLFAVPVALAAALYSAQFLNPAFRRMVKPTMEIMASLPSVVLGFLAALWLAPLIDNRIPSVLLGLLFIPLSGILMAALWGVLPQALRRCVPDGREFLPMIVVVALAFAFGWWLGPFVEKIAFSVADPVTGEVVADFRLWWQEVLGFQYEQRNALVIGFMMGFAVIPIIFSLSEDAMDNVPPALVSGSLALGAGRWETARRIVLPIALPGIFSALMIGLGRAVGETMIVVMATGNTPLTDFNLFTGLRSLSANIAVELPEAPFRSTLYRTLFLGAMILFILTFAVNTLAEITRERIRRRGLKLH